MKIVNVLLVGAMASILLVGCDSVNDAQKEVSKAHETTKVVNKDEGKSLTQDEQQYVDTIEFTLEDYLSVLNNVVELIDKAESDPLVANSSSWKKEMRKENKEMYDIYKTFEAYNNVPSSFKGIHKKAVDGLSLIYLGVFDIIEGVDKSKNDMIAEGGDFINKGSSKIQEANDMVDEFKNKFNK